MKEKYRNYKLMSSLLAISLVFSCTVFEHCGFESTVSFGESEKFGVSEENVEKESKEGNLIYKYNASDKTAIVKKCNNSEVEKIEIPEYVQKDGENYTVTIIGAKAFEGFVNLKFIKLPNSITIIKWKAFEDCTKLKSIDLPCGLQRLETNAFCRCSSLQSIIVPQSVETLGRGVFKGCCDLKSAILLCNINSLRNGTFAYCNNLKLVVLEYGLQKIKSEAFAFCLSLDTVVIQDSVTEIHSNAFEGCKNLKNAKVSMLTEVDYYAFPKHVEIERY